MRVGRVAGPTRGSRGALRVGSRRRCSRRLIRCAHVSRCSGGVDGWPLDAVVKLEPIGCHPWSVGALELSNALMMNVERSRRAVKLSQRNYSASSIRPTARDWILWRSSQNGAWMDGLLRRAPPLSTPAPPGPLPVKTGFMAQGSAHSADQRIVIPRPHPILVLDPLAKRLPPILANTYLPTIWAHIYAQPQNPTHSNFCYEGQGVYLSSRLHRCLRGLPKLDYELARKW